MPKRNSIIALLTDFGLADAYVGIMKGVIYTFNPQARIIDISHEVEPQQVDQAAFLLWSSYRYYPKGTIFVCVVDPCVGGSRKILCAQTNMYTFIAPDNGVMKFILGEAHVKNVYDVSKPKVFTHPISSTFHGRDIFAPIAASLSQGEKPLLFGRPVHAETQVESFISVNAKTSATYEGKIIHIDRFGNIITNLMLPETRLSKFVCKIEKKRIERQVEYYAESESDEFVIVRGSSRLLEISKRNYSAARQLNAVTGQRVTLEVKEN